MRGYYSDRGASGFSFKNRVDNFEAVFDLNEKRNLSEALLVQIDKFTLDYSRRRFYQQASPAGISIKSKESVDDFINLLSALK